MTYFRKARCLMEEREAIAIATKLIESRGTRVERAVSARRMPVDMLPPSQRSQGDLWSVIFPRVMPKGVIECPGEIIVTVIDATGEASVFATP